jgi:hypothetical protein
MYVRDKYSNVTRTIIAALVVLLGISIGVNFTVVSYLSAQMGFPFWRHWGFIHYSGTAASAGLGAFAAVYLSHGKPI